MGQTVTDPFEYAVREVRRGIIPLASILQRLLPRLLEASPDSKLVLALQRLLEGKPTLARWREALREFENHSWDTNTLNSAIDGCVRALTGWEVDHGNIRFPQDTAMAAHNLERLLKALPRYIDFPAPYTEGREKVVLALWGRTSAPWEG